MPKMSTIQCYSHYVAIIKHSTLNLRSCMATPRTDTCSCAMNCSAHGIPSYNHKASDRSTTLLPLGEWPRFPLSQDLDPSPVRRICEQWIGVYPHIKAVALVTIRFMYYHKAASVEMFSTRLHYFWANSCFLAAMTLLISLVLLYVSKTKRSTIPIVLSLIGSAVY